MSPDAYECSRELRRRREEQQRTGDEAAARDEQAPGDAYELSRELRRTKKRSQNVSKTKIATEIPLVVQDWLAAWKTDNPATALADLYTNEGIYVDMPTLTASEPGQIEDFLDETLNQIRDTESVLRHAFRVNKWVAIEWDYSFRYTGQFPGLPPGSGQTIGFKNATIFKIDGDKIVYSADYYEIAPLLAAVGVLPRPDAGMRVAKGNWTSNRVTSE